MPKDKSEKKEKKEKKVKDVSVADDVEMVDADESKVRAYRFSASRSLLILLATVTKKI